MDASVSMYSSCMNGVELFLLGRTLMKIGEQAMPQVKSGSPGATRSVLVVLGDLVSHPGATVGEIAERTGLPQSQVSTAVARLETAGSVDTEPDPADRRRPAHSAHRKAVRPGCRGPRRHHRRRACRGSGRPGRHRPGSGRRSRGLPGPGPAGPAIDPVNRGPWPRS
ncbi:helix-turn-helix domain-containing protein [Streptomyces sp. NBC_00162]|uniref:MarR family transcriptional regulator n=1 Tax=Streptomyces sp. NBC_00162 TaxID=2903629 RepID=UPI002AFE0F54|nr:helix-turn-helix domain-containing protein [Streptomyces sp. NBC_00162]